MRMTARITLASTALLLGACGGANDTAEPGGTAPPAASSPEGDWVLVEGEAPGGPVPVIEGSPITLTIEGTELSGTAACNSYGGTADLDDERFRPRDLHATEMACDPPEVMDSEQAYLEAFRDVESHQHRDDELVLDGDGVRLVFAADGT